MALSKRIGDMGKTFGFLSFLLVQSKQLVQTEIYVLRFRTR